MALCGSLGTCRPRIFRALFSTIGRGRKTSFETERSSLSIISWMHDTLPTAVLTYPSDILSAGIRQITTTVLSIRTGISRSYIATLFPALRQGQKLESEHVEESLRAGRTVIVRPL